MNCSLRYFECNIDAKVQLLDWECVGVGSTDITMGDFFNVECHALQREWSSFFATPVGDETRVHQQAEFMDRNGTNVDFKVNLKQALARAKHALTGTNRP
jgi:hypothetical protein